MTCHSCLRPYGTVRVGRTAKYFRWLAIARQLVKREWGRLHPDQPHPAPIREYVTLAFTLPIDLDWNPWAHDRLCAAVECLCPTVLPDRKRIRALAVGMARTRAKGFSVRIETLPDDRVNPPPYGGPKGKQKRPE